MSERPGATAATFPRRARRPRALLVLERVSVEPHSEHLAGSISRSVDRSIDRPISNLNPPIPNIHIRTHRHDGPYHNRNHKHKHKHALRPPAPAPPHHCHRPAPALAPVPTPLLLGELERRLYCRRQPSRNLVLLGKPGAEKGTVAKQIEERHCLCHIAIRDVLWAEQRAGTLLGRRTERKVERGQLVDDGTALYILRREMARPECSKGFVLNGLPRSTCQAKQLDSFLGHAGLGIEKVIALEVSDAEGERRLQTPSCTHPPAVSTTCGRPRPASPSSTT